MKKYGMWTNSGRSYTITNMHTPRPWFNFLWNDSFLMQIDQFGGGKSWHSSEKMPYVPHNNTGVASDLGSVTDNRLVFVKDNESNKYWAANRNFHNEKFELFQSEVNPGWTEITSIHNKIKCSLLLCVPEKDNVECWQIKVTNLSNKERELTIFPYSNSSFCQQAHNACQRVDWKDKVQGLLFENSKSSRPLKNSYFSSDIKPNAYETTDRRFRGMYGILSDPDAVQEGDLSSKGTNFEWQMIAAFQYNLKLKPNEEWTVNIVSGLAKSENSAQIAINNYFSPNFLKFELQKLKDKTQEQFNSFNIESDNENIDNLVNIWLKRQISLGQQWGRVYGRGFRDIMQDCAAFVGFDAQIAKKTILYALTKQFADGNTIRQWSPEWRHPYRDGAVWVPTTITAYIKETGDFSILDEKVDFFESDETASVLDHIRRGMDFLLLNLGENGLCLWGGGDWNDSYDAAGLAGKGESIWLSQACVYATNTFCELLMQLNLKEESAKYAKLANQMKDNLNKKAYDKDHFIGGINDKGERLGTYSAKEAQFFLNTQTWAVISETANNPNDLMNLVETKLKCDYGYKLVDTPCTSQNPDVGSVTYMVPGNCENAAVYCHGNAFKIVADCLLERSDEAFSSLKKILPENPLNPNSSVEPYAVTNQYLGPDNPHRKGEANGTWITGTAGWVYRAIVENILGITTDYNQLKVQPCLTKEWSKIKIHKVFKNEEYDILIERIGYKKYKKILKKLEKLEKSIKL